MMDVPVAGAQDASSAARSPLRGLIATAIEILRTRVDLAATEVEIHLLALVRVMVWAFGALICILVALAFAVTALVVSLWDTHRMLGLLGGSGAFLALAVLFGWLGARTLRGKPGMLEGTLQQLRNDQRSAGGLS
ncbi:MAG: phage holin family protein [Gammaproteobacteria bacterium]|nr:phage holin family protein [Gammaproteobacteria bacterium]